MTEHAMLPSRTDARIAGLLYLIVVITGPFVLMYVPGQLFGHGGASATARFIATHELLYRVYIVAGLLSELCFIGVVLALYRLLRGVDAQLALLMVLPVLLDVPLAFMSLANQVATLAFISDTDFLAVFDKPQRDAIATLLINADRHEVLISEVFWGLWLLPLAALIWRSGFIPRWLGAWIGLNGLAYLVMSFTGLLSPEHLAAVSKATMPVLFGEVALTLWLLFVGFRARGR